MPEQILERTREKKRSTSLFPEIAQLLNISVSELESKPEDIQQLLLYTYTNGTNQTETRKQLLNIVAPNYDMQRDLRMDNLANNPLKSVEELVEGNYDSIDGIINNEPPKKDKELSISRNQIQANAAKITENTKDRSHEQDYLEK